MEGDGALVRRARRGDRDAFGRLAERHRGTVFRFLAGYVTDYHAAEELTQETLLLGFQRLRQLRDPERVRGWLLAIARNLARRWLRVRRRWPRQGVDPETPAPPNDPGAAERLTAVMQALAQLTEDEREIVVLFELEGLSHAEIAAITGTKEGALRSRLFRARRRLRRMLDLESGS